MHWQDPVYLWAELLPGVLACAWILSEWQCYHRFRDFCDPRVMGIVTPWKQRIAAMLMLLFGLSAVIALLAGPMRGQESAALEVSEIQFMLDLQSLDGRPGSFWEGLESSVQALAEQIPKARFAFSIAAAPPRMLVYPTADARGLQIMVSGLRFAPQRDAQADLGMVLSKHMASRSSRAPQPPLAVISALSSDELERIAAPLRGYLPAFTFICLRGDKQPPQYGIPAAAEGWIWTSDPGQAGGRMLLMPQAIPRSSGSLKLTQWLALAALLFFGSEHVLAQSARTRMGGRQSG
jgi:hypothetical protein